MKTRVGILAVATLGLILVSGACQRSQPKPSTQVNQPPATQPVSRPAKEFALDLGNKVSMKLVLVPAGKFMMGNPETERCRGTDETPHEVTISKAFYMGSTHVTVDQFAAFVKDSRYKSDAEKDGWSYGYEFPYVFDGDKIKGTYWHNPGFDQTGDHPVVHMGWNDAKAFCDWLSKKTGRTVALPTEAQWEYACRAGTKTAYPWGNSPDDGKGWANCADQTLKKKLPPTRDYLFFSWDDGFVFTSPVMSFRPNAFGLYDMIGNAFQWCADWHDKDYYANSSKADPRGPTSGQARILRGSSWNTDPVYCRSAYRGSFFPKARFCTIGFRVVLD
jgi:formylglycine-generating enzyme required for sulfatase activity